MIRTAARKALLLAAGALTVGAMVVSCNSPNRLQQEDGISNVALEVVLASGVEVLSVDYSITGNGIVPRTGVIDVSGKNAKVAVLVSGLPPGVGYLVELKATATDGTTKCAGSANFDIVAGATTSVSVLLQCRQAATTGAVAINGAFNTCPVVTGKSVSPLATDVGKTIALLSSAADPDCTATSGGVCTTYEAVTSTWSASGGTVTPGTGGAATFTCTTAGVVTLTLTITDSRCTVTDTTEVTCVSDLCGNGMIDASAGEECDGTNVPNPGQTCSTSCRLVPNCGNGFREGAEQCDPPSVGPGLANLCDSMCRTIVARCGDNMVQASAGEECDPPAAGTCTAMCKNIVVVPPRCGDGTVNQTTEQCDDGNTVDVGDGCNNACQITLSACEQCESDGWTIGMRSTCDPTKSGCSLLTGPDKTLCQAVVTCVRTTGCAADANGDTQPCFCGTAPDDVACLSGEANGVCKPQIEAAARCVNGMNTACALTVNAGQVATRFANPAYPLGRAANLIKCDAAACRAPICVF